MRRVSHWGVFCRIWSIVGDDVENGLTVLEIFLFHLIKITIMD